MHRGRGDANANLVAQGCAWIGKRGKVQHSAWFAIALMDEGAYRLTLAVCLIDLGMHLSSNWNVFERRWLVFVLFHEGALKHAENLFIAAGNTDTSDRDRSATPSICPQQKKDDRFLSLIYVTGSVTTVCKKKDGCPSS
jgi:hypothetical protein